MTKANAKAKTDRKTTATPPPVLARSEARPITSRTPYAQNARRHSDKQIDLLARSIQAFGFVNPILVDASGVIVGGHGRYEAAQRLGLETVPVVELAHLSPDEVRAYRIADNRIAELSDWDEGVLRLEIQSLIELELAGNMEFEVSLTGFSTPQIDLILDPVGSAPKAAEQVELPSDDAIAVTRLGDAWELGKHRLICGDALSSSVHALLLGPDEVRLVFTDPPYNVPIQGHVRSGGKTRHREFAMGVGEMSEADFDPSSRKASRRRPRTSCPVRCSWSAWIGAISRNWWPRANPLGSRTSTSASGTRPVERWAASTARSTS